VEAQPASATATSTAPQNRIDLFMVEVLLPVKLR